MVLTFNRPTWVIEFRREKLPRVLTWLLLLVIAVLFAYNYFDNPLPGPYGACYTGRAGTVPCKPIDGTKRANESALPVARGR
jgi:hypothetical protein